MRGILIRVAIVGAIIVAFIVLRPLLPGNASTLAVGDCFDVPTGNETIEDVQHHPCTEPHGGEVIHSAKYEGPATAYPTDAEFEDYVADKCLPAFETYTGRTYEAATDLNLEWFVPTSESWADGNKKVVCYALNADGTQLSKSIKAGS
jgi:hypothetical protein